ncbi:ZIP family metal transporter [Candidatus Omnitrophota bacterium]
MNILTFKFISMAVIVAAGIAGGIISRRVIISKQKEKLFSVGNAFAGGIFLGASLLHMIPDARHGFIAFIPEYDFPWAAFLCACGFVMVLFLQRVLLYGDKAVRNSEMKKPGRTFSPHIFTLSLCIHSIIVGIALGTEYVLSKAVVILIAIITYKLSATFALEVSMHRAGIKGDLQKKISVIFCSMTPLGILFGVTLTAFLQGKAEQILTSAFDALAAGTFLYLALIDIIEEEFIKFEYKWLKFGLLLFGLALMTVIAIWT